MTTDWSAIAVQVSNACRAVGGTMRNPRPQQKNEDIASLTLGMIPVDLSGWLAVCGGATLGRYSLLGAFKTSESPSIRDILSAFWCCDNYIPIAIDDFGCYYAIRRDGCAIVFIDEDDTDVPQFAVSTSLARFIQMLIAATSSEIDDWHVQDFILKHDPKIVDVHSEKLPWDSEET